MRLLGRLLLLLLLVPPMAWISHAAWNSVPEWGGGELATLTRLGTAQTTIAYALDPERWTQFPFSGTQEAVRIVSHADVAAVWRDDPEAEFRYAFVLQVLDARGAVLGERVLHQRVGISALRDVVSGEAFTTAAYADATEIPTASTALVISLDELPGAASVRLRLASAGPEISRALVRVQQRTTNQRRTSVQWERMTEAQREALARGNAYPAALLTGEERHNLLRRQWRPIGPSGVAGRDYRARPLFLLQDLCGEPIDPPALPPGLLLDADRDATLRLPEQGAALTLRVAPLPGSGAASSGMLRLNWYSPGLAQREAHELPWSLEQADLQVQLGGGLVEFASDGPVAVRAFLPDGTELTANPSQLRAYVTGPEASVTFPVLHLPGQTETPLRLDLRCLCFDPAPLPGGGGGTAAALRAAAMTAGPGAAPRLHWQMLSANGMVVGQGVHSTAVEPSRLDRLLGNEALVLSEPARLYFHVPHEVAELQLWTSAPMLIAGYNRPPDLPRRAMVPEDRFAPSDPLDTRPVWFGLRPAGWETLISENRTALLLTHPRPPEDDPEILAGRYEWEQFMASGNWLARDVMAPRASTPTRRLSLNAIFSPLPLGEEVVMEMVPATPGSAVTPTLLYLRETSGPVPLRVEVDGRPHLAAAVAAARGTVALPPVMAGARRIRASGPPGTMLYLNHAEPLSGALVSRRAIRLAPGETVFDYEKRSGADADRPEMVVAHVYPEPSPGAPARQLLAISIEGGPARAPGPHSGFTLRERLFDIRRGPEPADVRVLGTAAMAGPERALLLPFGADLPPGRYRIRIRLADGPEALLSLTRTTPGPVERRDIRREQIPGGAAVAR
jgi:hypothetical protein